MSAKLRAVALLFALAAPVLAGCVRGPVEESTPPTPEVQAPPVTSPPVYATPSPVGPVDDGRPTFSPPRVAGVELDVAQGVVPDLRVTVNATTGPHGGAPVSIDRRLYGMNIADWQPQDYQPTPNATYAAYLAALRPGILRWPAGDSSQELVWSRDAPAEKAPHGKAPGAGDTFKTPSFGGDDFLESESLDAKLRGLRGYQGWPADADWAVGAGWDGKTPTKTKTDVTTRPLSPAHVDAFIGLARAVGAEPVIAVNLVSGTPAEAADLVRYANLEQGYGVRWWQLGNEPDVGKHAFRSAREYADTAMRFAKAMREVDPSIRLVGGELATGAHVVATNGQADWVTPMLQRAGSTLDAVSWHYYPLDSGQKDPNSPAAATPENLLQERADDWRPAGLDFVDEVFPALDAKRGTLAPGVERWVTEFGEDPARGGASGIVDTQAGALWTAEVLGRFAGHGADAVAKFVFKSGMDHNFTLLDAAYVPRPAYATYWAYANHFGDRVIAANSTDASAVSAHAAMRDDGALTVVMVNKANEPKVAGLELPRAADIVDAYVVGGTGLDARDAAVNGIQLTTANVAGAGVAPIAVGLGEAPAIRLPAHSVTVLVIPPSR